MMAAEQGAQQLCKSTVSMRAIVSAVAAVGSTCAFVDFCLQIAKLPRLSSTDHNFAVGSVPAELDTH